jgi:iron complex outermembrane recepter protein
MNTKTFNLRPRLAAALPFIVRLTSLLLLPSFASAQQSPALSAPTSSSSTDEADDGVVLLSPFTVTTTQDIGYRAGNSVSATRIDTPIKQLPFSVSAFTDQFITDIAAHELNDVAIFAPSVTTGSKEFTQGNTRLSIRGFDGDVTPQRNGFVGNRYVDTGNIERVEVVKGPASLLYGQITPGGTANYITKRPTPKAFAAIKTQLGTESFLRTEVDVNRPLVGEKVLFRFAGAFENGFESVEPSSLESTLIAPSLSFRLTENSTLIFDYEWLRRRENPNVGMKPNLAVAVTPTAGNFPNVAARARAQAYQDVGNLNLGFIGYPPLPAEFNYPGNNDYRRSDFETVALEYTIKLGENWTARANYNWNKLRIANKLTGLAEFTVTPTAAYLGTSGLNRFDLVAELRANPAAVLADTTKVATALLTRRKRIEESYGFSNSYQAELVGKIRLGETATLKPLFGVFLSSQDGTGRRRESTANPPASTPNSATTPTQHFQPWNYRDPSTWDRAADYDVSALALNNYRFTDSVDKAAYAVLSLDLLDERLIVVGGARYNKTETDVTNRLNGAMDPHYETSKTTPQLGVGFRFTPEVMLFGSYSESFFIEERTLTALDQSTQPAKPTTGEGYEIGLKTDLMGGRISSTVSLFNLERTDRILRFRELNEATGVQVTVTRQGTVDRSRGVECEITWSPIDNWQVFASASFMDIETIQFTPPVVPVSTDPVYRAAYELAYNEAVQLIRGAVPEGSSERLVNLWTRYTFKGGPLDKMWMAGGFNYVSPKAQRTANPTLFFDAYTTCDTAIGYDFKWNDKPCSVALNWKNMTDEEYFPANQARGLPSRLIGSFSVKF